MKAYLLFVVLLLPAENLWAQFSGSSTTYAITGPQNYLKSEIPLAEPVVKGSTYLDEQWHKAEIVLEGGYGTEDLPVRIEIEQANIEIMYKGEVKYLDLRKVDHINYANNLTNARQVIKRADGYLVNGEALKGIVMVHQGKRYSAIKHFYIEFIQANYNVALDVGSKDHRKVKKEKLYIAEGNLLIPVKGKEKTIVSKLGADREKALAIIKQHKLKLSREEDLNKLVDLL